MKHLYFIQNTVTGTIKIGVAQRVERRRNALERACGYPLRVLLVVPYGVASEALLHKRFARHRLVGEWFNPAPRLVSLIARAARPRVDPGAVIDRFLGVSDPHRVTLAADLAVEQRPIRKRARMDRSNTNRSVSRAARMAERASDLQGEWWRRFTDADVTTAAPNGAQNDAN